METKKYTQSGTFAITIFLLLIVLVTGRLILSLQTGGSEGIIHYVVLFSLIIGLLFFYKLTIQVDVTQVSFKFGIGLFGKSYNLSDIKSVRPVRNSLISGLGIRILFNGWLYNVSGFKAIELEFKSRSSVVRIGTDRPEEISEIINKLIGEETALKHEQS